MQRDRRGRWLFCLQVSLLLASVLSVALWADSYRRTSLYTFPANEIALKAGELSYSWPSEELRARLMSAPDPEPDSTGIWNRLPRWIPMEWRLPGLRASAGGGVLFVVPLWFLTLLSLSSALLIHFIEKRRTIPGLCPTCKYSRNGLAPTSPCPECGHTTPNNASKTS